MSYDFDWHRKHGDKTLSSAVLALGLLREVVPFESVLDIGCGDGRWLSVARTLGVKTIQGVDGPWTDTSKLLIDPQDVRIQDLSQPLRLDRQFDLAISLEVAEHVETRFSDVFVDHLTSHSDFILFGAAIPGQGGYRHINEQWQSFWLELFHQRGYRAYDLVRSLLWNDRDSFFWYAQNAIIYANEQNSGLIERLDRFVVDRNIQQIPVDVVHPSLFKPISSYTQIAFKPLMRQLPKRAYAKIRNVLARKI